MEDLKNLSLEELKIVLKNWEKPNFHASQIFSWLYKKSITDFDRMSDLPLDLRQKLIENYYLYGLKLVKSLSSSDRTEKFLFQLRDKNFIEAVSIPAEARVTGCVSTQVGCKFSCQFCASGAVGFKRNLTVGEIIEEVLFLKNKSKAKTLTNLVFMGTGEPLDNYDNLLKAIRIINSRDGLNIGARRITISTSGVIPGIKKLSSEELQVELSISLHAADDKTRSLMMPINKLYPLSDLMLACREYISKTNRQITFEYILIAGLNSDLQNAKRLSRILTGLNCKVNLIPCNPIAGLKAGPPKKLEVLIFKDHLLKSGLNVTLRKPRGEDIEAACGQLRLRHEKN